MGIDRELLNARNQAQKKRQVLLDIVSGSGPAHGREEHTGLVAIASEVVRKHPLGSTGAGLAFGFALASCHEPLMREIEKSLKDVTSRVSTEASTMAHEALSNSMSGIATEILRQVLARV